MRRFIIAATIIFAAVAVQAQPAEPLARASFEGDLEGWTLQLNRGAEVELSYPEDAASGRHSLRLEPRLLCAPGDLAAQTNIHIWLERFSFEPGMRYELSAWAKADVARRPFLIGGRRMDEPVSLGLSTHEATTRWRRFTHVFEADEALDDVRLQIVVGGDERPIMIDGVAFRELGEEARLPADYVAVGTDWATPEMWTEGGVTCEPEVPSVTIEGTALFGAKLPPNFTLHMVMRSEDPATVLVGSDTAEVSEFEMPGGESVAVRCERARGESGPAPASLRFSIAGGPVEVLSMEGYEMLPPRRDGDTEREEFTDAETGARIVRLTHSPYEDKHAYYDVDPWSPDGSTILFCSALPGQRATSVWVMDADGSNMRKLGDSDSFSYHTGCFPVWAADGESVYWRDHREIEGERSLGTVRHFLADGREEFMPINVRQVSPRGLLLETRSAESQPEQGLFVAEADGGDRRMLASMDAILALSPSRERVEQEGLRLNLQNCKWNADGSRCFVVFAGRDERGRAMFVEVYTVNADGTGLTYSCSIAHHPIWHPDGERILFNAADGMYLVNWDGTGLRKVSDCNVGHPSVSPDGSTIVTDGYGATWGDALWLIDLETGETRKLCNVPNVHGRSHERGTQPHPVFSHDGTRVLYDSDESGRSQLYEVVVGG